MTQRSMAGVWLLVTMAVLAMGGCKQHSAVVSGMVSGAGPISRAVAGAAAGYSASRAVTPQRRGGPRRADNSKAGVFDFYLLTLSWSPEYCVSHLSAAECAAHPAFVLHGLWPENTDGTYPESCSNAPGPANPGQYKDIFPDAGLLAHEWKTHGTCSGLGPDAYFVLARQAFHSVKTPAQIDSIKTVLQLTPAQILGDFTQGNAGLSAADLAVSCGNNRLTAVEVCLTKGLKPTSCAAVKSCRANVVKITPPGATSDQ